MRSGLAASVGSAGRPARLALAVFFACCGAIMAAIATLVRLPGYAGAMLAAVFLQPLAAISAVAAIFILSPRGRLGLWLEGDAGAGIMTALWAGGAAVVLATKLIK